MDFPTIDSMDVAPNRHFLDWNQPAIESALHWCLENHLTLHGELDLDRLIIVTPGRRASRLLLSRLVDHCQSNRIPLTPPKLITPSGIARELLTFKFSQASEISKKLVWVQALKSTNPKDLSAIVPNPPDHNQWDQWLGLASWLSSTTSQLSDAGLRMNQVSSNAMPLLDEIEQRRWETLGSIQDRYEQLLQSQQVVDDHLESLRCIESNQIRQDPQHFVLLGVPELGFIPRACLQSGQSKITPLIFAPESMQEMFDELGCVRTEAWTDYEIEIEEHKVVFTTDPKSMCEQGLAILATKLNPIDSNACVIGLADESILGTLRRTAELIDTESPPCIHNPAGLNILKTLVGQLVKLIHTYLSEPTYTNLACLIRHPHFEQALTARYIEFNPDQPHPNAIWVRSVDELIQDHVLLDSNQLPAGVRDSTESNVRFVINTTVSLLEHLTRLPVAEPTLDQWSARLIQTLRVIYKLVGLSESSSEDRQTIQQLEVIQRVHEELASAHSGGHELPELTAAAALSILLAQYREVHIPEHHIPDSIESVGWLELALDPSSIAVVLGMNDSAVPGAITYDPLLPGSLRTQLGMRTNNDRLARDAYLLDTIYHSRDAVFMSARASASNEPSTPSRLLFQTNGSKLAHRMRRFVEPIIETATQYQLKSTFKSGTTDLSYKPLVAASDYSPPESMSVTEFDSYLRSPAAWYLDRSLRLHEIQTDARELNALQIGNLTHAVLDAFGKDEVMRVLTDPSKINSALQHLLNVHFLHIHGSSQPGAVKVQFELLSYRLRLFAEHQSQRAQLGWQIAHTEWTPPQSSKVQLETNSAPMPLRGKIDRIDLHPDGKIAIIDYKTGRITDPIKAHIHNDEWIKLQLPLYRHLAAELIEDRSLELGYAGLPSIEDDDVWSITSWDEEHLASADQCAIRVVKEIRSLNPGDPIPLGEYPPSAGINGFISGERFEIGGFETAIQNDETLERGDL